MEPYCESINFTEHSLLTVLVSDLSKDLNKTINNHQ